MIENNQLKIFVEGMADKTFLQHLIKHRFNPQYNLDNIIVSVGGKDDLFREDLRLEFSRVSDNGGKALIVFDADKDIHSRKQDIVDGASVYGINLDKNEIFLFPNNNGSGDLESLLICLMNRDSYSEFFECFENYKRCLEGYQPSSGTKVNIPDRKADVYVYLSVHCQEAREEKRNYLDSAFWDLNHSDLDPLVKFLRPYFS